MELRAVARTCGTWFWRGARDAVCIFKPFQVCWSVPEVGWKVWDCVKLNCLIWVIPFVFYRTLEYTISYAFGHENPVVEKLTRRLFTLLFVLCFSLPTFVISAVLNLFWCQDVADMSLRVQLDRRGAPLGVAPRGIDNVATELAYSFLLITVVVTFQNFLISWFPYVGGFAFFVASCFLNAFTFFDYKWIHMRYPIAQRLDLFHSSWIYFLGYGFPFTFFLWMSGYNRALYYVLFPLYIIISFDADPQPLFGSEEDKLSIAPVPRTLTVFGPATKGSLPVIRRLVFAVTHVGQRWDLHPAVEAVLEALLKVFGVTVRLASQHRRITLLLMVGACALYLMQDSVDVSAFMTQTA